MTLPAPVVPVCRAEMWVVVHPNSGLIQEYRNEIAARHECETQYGREHGWRVVHLVEAGAPEDVEVLRERAEKAEQIAVEMFTEWDHYKLMSDYDDDPDGNPWRAAIEAMRARAKR